MAPFLSEPVFVGRTQEIKQLQQALQSASVGNGKTIFISGEAGSGKTRLVNEFLKVVKDQNLTILSGWCLANAALPYFPFLEAFSSLSHEDLSGASASNQYSTLTWLFEPYNTGKIEDKIMVPQVWKDQTFAAVTKELLFMSSVKTIILILEDMQWADSASNALLHYISRAICSERILILATFRCEEVATEQRNNPFGETVHLMGREALFQEIRLQNLNQANVGLIAESMLGGRVDSQFVENLSKESQGNPLFVVESLRMLAESRGIVQKNNKWQPSGGKIDVPSRVKEVILRRLSYLTPDERRILDVASVIGEKFDPELIGAVLAQDSLDILEKLDTVLKSTALLRAEENHYVFNHAKSQEILYGEISPPLKKGYHSRVAEKLANLKVKTPPFSSIAFHYTQTGNMEKAIEYSLAAAQDALNRFSNIEAIDHFSFVLKAIGPLQLKEKTEALEGVGDAYYASGLFEDAIATYDVLANSIQGAGKLRAYRKEMEAVWYKEQDSNRLMDLVKKAEKYAALDHVENARVRWNRARAIMWLGQMEEALIDHQEALKVFEEEYLLPDIAQLSFGLGVNRVMLGLQDEQGIGEIIRAIAIFREIGDIKGEIQATLIGGGECFLLSGLFSECYSNLANVIIAGEKIGDFDDLAQLWWRLSDVEERKGNISEAITYCLKALEYSNKTDTKGTQCKIFANLLKFYSLNGDHEQAGAYYRKLIQIPSEIRFHPRNSLNTLFSQSVFFAIKKDWKKAYELSKQIADDLTKQYPHSIGLALLLKSHEAWLLDLQGKDVESKELTDEINSIIVATDKKYQHPKIFGNLIIPKEVSIGEEFDIRLDLVNVGKVPCKRVKVKDLLPFKDFQIVTTPTYCIVKNGFVELINPILAFQCNTIRFKAKAGQSGSYSLNPEISYVNDLDEIIISRMEQLILNVKREYSAKEPQELTALPIKLEFKSIAANKAFEFLCNAYREDYFKRRFTKENSGWRTLTDIAKQAKITQYSLYGSPGKRGHAISELERLGGIEARYFLGERGRGGQILKIRIAVEKENINNYVK